MKVTLKDIANDTGVSCSTISRVITNRGYVSAETRSLIEQSIIKNGYNSKAIHKVALASASNTVLIICGNITTQTHADQIRGIYQCLYTKKYKVLTAYSDSNSDWEESYIQYAVDNKFAGVLLLTAIETTSLIYILKSVNIPVVLVNRYLRTFDTDLVCIDNYRGGYLATKYLIDCGHKKIAHLCGPESSIIALDRMRGYLDALRDSGIPDSNVMIFKGDLHYESGRECGTKLSISRNGITAIYSENDEMTIGLIDALVENDINIPEDISVISPDNTASATTGKVKITTYGYDNFSIGTAAGELLLERLANPEMVKKRIFYSPSLVIRDSVKIIN